MLDALQRAYATEAEIIGALTGEVIALKNTGEVVVAVPPGADEDNYHMPYTIAGVRLQARGPVFNDDLAFLGVECAYTVEYTIRREPMAEKVIVDGLVLIRAKTGRPNGGGV